MGRNIFSPHEQNRDKKMTASQSNVMTISWQISAVKHRIRMAFRRQITAVTIHCDKCDIELARREMIMLAIIPPSHHHLAVRQEKEADAFEKLKKVENTKGGKSAQYCPWIVLCRQCGMHVGKVTLLLSKQFVCYKIENIYLVNNGEEIRAKKLCKIRSRLEEECCIEVVDVSSAICQSQLQPSEPMIYCDTSGLTHASPEIDFLTQQCPRDYQRELFLSVMRKNTLVCLPTGSGKTLVAAMALSCMKKLNPDKLMVFLVDRVPLVYQQSEYIRSQVPELRVMTLVGEMESPQQKAVHQALANQKVDVLVLTHQIFLNFLAIEKNPIVRLSDISVLVFDEAHHCRGRHQYNQIMEYYHVTPNKFKPIVLGLTASPAGGVTVERTTDQLKELLDNLSCEVSTPIESNDLAENVNNPDTLYCTVREMNTRQVVLLRIIQEHIQYLKTSYLDDAHRSQRFAGFPLFSSNFRGAVRRLNDSCHGDKTKTKAVIAGEHIMQMLSIVDVCEVLGCERAMECLRECVHNITHELSPKGSALSKMVREDATFRDLRGLADSSVDEESPISDRYNILVAHIKQFVCQVQQDESSRGIVFVSMRKTAYKLCEQIRMLPEVPETLNPKVFVGHGQGSYDGMAWVDEQEVLLQCFKTGQTKLLISTSVLEEGLDVPECNLVIRFEGAATLRALVQTRGRASRRPGSKFVVICNERQKQEAEDVVLKERNMEEAIRHLMENNRRKLQSEDFGCEVKRLDSFVPTSNETIEITNKKYNPQVSISVHHLGTLEHQQHVVEFLEQKFEVMAMKTNTPSSSGSEGSRRKDLSFDLQPNEDGNCKEFRSKEGFICHVTEEWCSYLTKPEEEPLPVWLKASFTKKRHRAEDTFHSLRANSLFLGTFLTRCQFRYQWPSEPTLNNVLIYFDHSLKILTIGFKTYRLELRYEELEDFIIVNSDVASGVIKLFLTIKHPPRLFQSVDHPFLDVGGDNEQGPHENDDDDFLQVDVDDICSELSDDGSESESDSFSTDEEYPDPNMKRPLRHEYNFDKIAWERLPDILNSENAWAHCYTYCFVLPCNESSQIIHLLSRIQNRFNKKAFYCRVKESFGRFPVTDIPPNLPFDVKYASQMVISRHPVMRGKISSTFSELLLNKPTSVACAALEQLKKALEQDSFCDPEKAFKAFLGQNNPSASGFQNRPIPGHCALIKRAVITPTRLLLYPPEVMVKNRVLRQYETESFLCVSVRDEDLSKLSAGGGSLDPLLDGINRVLDEGLNIAGQRFQFLGSSNSQLRNHSCWFVGPKFEPDIIRRWMGDFSHIKYVRDLCCTENV